MWMGEWRPGEGQRPWSVWWRGYAQLYCSSDEIQDSFYKMFHAWYVLHATEWDTDSFWSRLCRVFSYPMGTLTPLTESNTSAPTWIYSRQSIGKVNLGLPFTTNVTISISILQTLFLRSNIPTSPAHGVFISQLIRYSRACSSYECFIPRRCDFPISFSDRDMSRNVWNRL